MDPEARQVGYKASSRDAVATHRSETGRSGGCLVAASKGLASYSLGPLASMEQYSCGAENR